MYKVKFRSYECKICKTKYASSGSLWGHNKKFHSNENSHNIVTDISTNNSYSHDLVINDNNIENDNINIVINDSNNSHNITVNENDLKHNSHNITTNENESVIAENNTSKKYNCRLCSKNFCCLQNRWRHEKNVKPIVILIF
jgi:hypothetical protein